MNAWNAANRFDAAGAYDASHGVLVQLQTDRQLHAAEDEEPDWLSEAGRRVSESSIYGRGGHDERLRALDEELMIEPWTPGRASRATAALETAFGIASMQEAVGRAIDSARTLSAATSASADVLVDGQHGGARGASETHRSLTACAVQVATAGARPSATLQVILCKVERRPGGLEGAGHNTRETYAGVATGGVADAKLRGSGCMLRRAFSDLKISQVKSS